MEALAQGVRDIRLLAYAVGPEEFRFASNFTEIVTSEQISAPGAVPNYTMTAVLPFIITIVGEWLLGVVMGKKLYRWNDSLVSMMLGALSLITGAVTKYIQFQSYCWVYNHATRLGMGMGGVGVVDGWPQWLLGFLGCDFAYYWMHRMSHTYHLMWTGHSVHHSGEDYNLATALRQGALQGVFSWAFYLPLAVCGLHPACYAGHSALNTLGQFWIHTKLIGSLGPLEYVLNTPTHHRCHHRVPGNCNYAGVLIVWDRLFCTFEHETQQTEAYGLARQYTTFDPTLANVQHGLYVAQQGGMTGLLRRRAHHKWTVDWLGPFRSLPPRAAYNWVATHSNDDAKRTKLDFPQHPLMTTYCIVHFLISFALWLTHMIVGKRLGFGARIGAAAWLLWCFGSVGRLFDPPSVVAYASESVRLAVLLALALYFVDVNAVAGTLPLPLPLSRATLGLCALPVLALWAIAMAQNHLFHARLQQIDRRGESVTGKGQLMSTPKVTGGGRKRSKSSSAKSKITATATATATEASSASPTGSKRRSRSRKK